MQAEAHRHRAPATGGVDHRLAKAFAHPLRVEILTILDQRVASPNEIAKELGEGLSLVSYHVKVLRDFECIELVETKQRRGATEHFYRAIRRPYMSDEDWREVPSFARGRISNAGVRMIVEDVVAALDAGTFDERDDRHLSRTHLAVDEEGWEKVVALLRRTLEQILEVQAECAERVAGSEDEPIPMKVAILGFQSPEPE